MTLLELFGRILSDALHAVEFRIMSFAGSLTRRCEFSLSNIDTAERPFSAMG
jgi:hypothetical protein